MNMDFAHIWGQMSFIVKGIMAILVFMSVYSLGVSLERWWVFRNAKKQSVKFALEIGPLLKQEKLKEAIDLAKKYKMSHVARVVSPGLLEFAYEAHGGSVAGHDVVAAAERAIARAAMMTAADMRKGLGGLATIATTSVFVGLLATVVGIIRAFQGMATSGTGGLGAVSAGIAEALIGTALGLFVAIPAVWLYNYFLNKIERFNIEMTNSASELVDYFIKRMGSRAA